MANTNKKSFDNTIDEMKRLMNFSVFETSDKKNYTSEIVEYKKVASDGKCYGIVREGNTYYIKVSEKTVNPLREDFDYIGNKAQYANSSYNLALKNIEFKLRSINESLNKKNQVVDSFNPSAKETIIAEERVTMSKEIARQRELMFKTSGLLKEGLGYKPVMTTDGAGKPDEKAEPFTDKAKEPKGTEVPSKGNVEPKKVGEPFNDEVKIDMKADPSKAGKKFKITGLQLKELKAKLKEGAGEGSPSPEDIAYDSRQDANMADVIPQESKTQVRDLTGTSTLARINNKQLSDLIENAPENMSPEDEYLYIENIQNIIGNMRLKGLSSIQLDRFDNNLYDILEANPIYIEATKNPNGSDEDFDVDMEPELYNDNEGFEDDVDSLEDVQPFEEGRRDPFVDHTVQYNNDHPIQHRSDNFNPYQAGQGNPNEEIFEMEEEELVEAILNVWGQVDSYGKTPMTMPGEGTRQYDVKKPVGFDKGTVVAPTKAEKELVAEPKDANKEMAPAKDIESTKGYMDKITEAIVKELKKKV